MRDFSDKSSALILYGRVVDRCILCGGTKTAHSVISLQLLFITSTQVDRFSVSLRDIQSSDVIISNCVGYVQILIYSAMFFSFFLMFISSISNEFGFVNSNGDIIECGLLTALRYCLRPSPLFSQNRGNPLQSKSRARPLILFAESFPTNNRAVLGFAGLSSATYASFPAVHLFALRFTFVFRSDV